MLPKVLITNCVPSDHLTPLEGVAEIIQGPADTLMPRAEVLKWAPLLTGIINQAELRVNEELLAAAPNLKIVASVSTGMDHLDLPLMLSRKVWATNVPNAFVESSADCTLALLLAVARKIVVSDSYVRSGSWAQDGFQPGRWDGTCLHGKTIGIIGYGKIGKAVAKRASGFGMKVCFNTRTLSTDPGYSTLDELLRESDVVCVHTPLTPANQFLINAGRIRTMKRGAILINMSRGKVVEDTAVAEALKGGHLAGAGLDVFENEPNVLSDFLSLPNVVLTPHIGGGTAESRKAARLLCAENVARVLKGLSPLNPSQPGETGTKSLC